jgi:predicted DNA-binding transcriptional regulator AlpA
MQRNRDYLSTREVAKILGVSRQTLYNWMKDGRIPAPRRHPLTTHPQWTPEDVDRIRGIVIGAHA